VHDAEGAREAILSAAEEVFAEHGFDGARIDVIAKVAGYNKSLLFQYFGDKLGLYAEVLKRADRGMTELQARLLTSLLEDESITSDAHKFKTLLETIVTAVFDYLVEHPRLARMMLWEQAEGWQTYAKIAPRFATEDIEQFEMLFSKARSAGLLRSSFSPVRQITMVMQLCQSYLAFLPLYRTLLPGEDVSSATALADAREYIVGFVIHGMMVDY
jgi:AcrR family transcriptional regulator